MALSKEDIIEIRAILLEDVAAILSKNSADEIAEEAKRLAREARANKIALTDPEAGERFRRLIPEF